MKKLIVGVVAVVFLVGTGAMAIDFKSQGLWQGNQNQSYDSYNFQGTSKSNTTTFAHTTDTSFTKYNQQNCNYDTHVFDIATSKAFIISNVQTDGNLQNQGLAMSQTGDQHSEATPAWWVKGAAVGGAGEVELGLGEAEGWVVLGGVVGGANNNAGADGQQNQQIGAVNAQFNGNLAFNVDKDFSASYGYFKNDVELDGFTANGSYNTSAWGVAGIGAVIAAGQVQLPLTGASFIAGAIVGGFAGEKAGEFALASNSYDFDFQNGGGFYKSNYDLDVTGHIDFQYQDGGGTAYQNSNTCAGISCNGAPTNGTPAP